MTAQRLTCTTAEYLADPAPEPSLSSSIAKVLLERSPAHARLVHPRLGGMPQREITAAQDVGTLIHRLVLGKGADIHPINAADYRTKAAQSERDAARSDGKIVCLLGQYHWAGQASMKIRFHLADAGVQLAGESEVPLLWQEQADHGAIYARGMLDHVVPRDGWLHVYDLKTCESAHPDACMRSVARFGYDIQAHAYTRAAELVWPEYEGRVSFAFLFCEVEPPYAVTVATLDSLMRERGRRRWERAVALWSRCLHTDTWPGYTTEPVTLESPGWLLYQEATQR